MNLKEFNDEIHKLGLGIIMFSGKPKQLLNPDLVASVDLLIDGPFIEKQKDNDRILVGSNNKNLSFITSKTISFLVLSCPRLDSTISPILKLSIILPLQRQDFNSIFFNPHCIFIVGSRLSICSYNCPTII